MSYNLKEKMDYKKSKAPVTTVTRNMIRMGEMTGNVYESVRIIGKRANEIAVEVKSELERKLEEFSTYTADSLDEIIENREQIEISRYFERLPKPTLIATQEFIDGEIYFRNPTKEKDSFDDL